MPCGIRARWPAVRHSHDVCPRRRRHLFSRIGGQPHAARAERRPSRLHYGYAHGWTGAGALGFQSLHELSLGGGAWQGHADRRPGRKAAGAAGLHGKIDSRTLERRAAAERERAEGHQHPETAADGSLRESPHWRTWKTMPTTMRFRVWAGIIPMHLVADAPVRDDRCDPAIPTPSYATNFRSNR